MAVDTLTDADIAILDMEKQWWQTASAKEDAIRALGIKPTRYYQRLNHLVGTTEALARDPVTVNRLCRIARSRSERR